MKVFKPLQATWNEAGTEYTFTDDLGFHTHQHYTGPYQFDREITCPACLDRLEALRLELCHKYGWSTWPSDLD